MVTTMASGAVLGALTKSFGLWMQHKQESHKRTMELLAGVEATVETARKDQSPGAAFGRRFITIMSFCLLAFLVVAPAVFDIAVNVPLASWIPFVDIEYVKLHGLVAFDVLFEILVATTSFYMGSATIGNR